MGPANAMLNQMKPYYIIPLSLSCLVTVHAQTSATSGSGVANTGTVSASTPSSVQASTMDLPRLRQHAKATIPQIKKANASVDDLSAQGTQGATQAIDQGVTYLSIDAGRDFSRPLRNGPTSVTFVTFFLYASAGTTLDICGAAFSVKTGSAPGTARLSLGDAAASSANAHELGDNLKLETFGKVNLTSLPVITVRIDFDAGRWDAFMFDRLLAANLPLSPGRGADRKFSLHAGAEGAWILGLVNSDENPLFVDANKNGIEDEFEKKQAGALLGVTADGLNRAAVLQQLKGSQRAESYKSWKVRRIVPIVPPAP